MLEGYFKNISEKCATGVHFNICYLEQTSYN